MAEFGGTFARVRKRIKELQDEGKIPIRSTVEQEFFPPGTQRMIPPGNDRWGTMPKAKRKHS